MLIHDYLAHWAACAPERVCVDDDENLSHLARGPQPMTPGRDHRVHGLTRSSVMDADDRGLRDGRLLVEEAAARCRERPGGHQCPRSVGFVEEFPRNAAGKILKRGLREPYRAGRHRSVG